MTQVPEPRRDLGNDGYDLWEQVWSVPDGLLSADHDHEMVLQLCEALDFQVELRAWIRGLIAAGDSIPPAAATLLARTDRRIGEFLNLSGLTPYARIKTSNINHSDDSPNDLAEFRRRSVLRSQVMGA